jgi:hypothetical protein
MRHRLIIPLAILGATGLILYGANGLLESNPEPSAPRHAPIPHPSIDRKYWAIEAYILPEKAQGTYRLELRRHPSMPFSWAMRTPDLKLSMLTGKHGPLPALSVEARTPDVLKPQPFLPPDLRERPNPLVKPSGDYIPIILRLDRKNAPAGMYVLQASGKVIARDEKTGEIAVLPGFHAELGAFLTPVPDKEPALQPGQRFLVLPVLGTSGGTPTPYRDLRTGKPITESSLIAHTLALKEVQGDRLIFVLEDHKGDIYLESKESVDKLPYLTPILTDNTVRLLKAKYEGRKVWRYGGSGGECVSGNESSQGYLFGDASLPLVIKRIERVLLPDQCLPTGPRPGAVGEPQTGFFTDNPIFVIMKTPSKGLRMESWSSINAAGPPPDLNKHVTKYCPLLWSEVSGQWDFERVYSLVSPFKAHPEWPAKVRQAIKANEIKKGMTYEMVAWSAGWPNAYGTTGELKKLSEWDYDAMPPYQTYVYFRNGKVVRADFPNPP